MTAGREHAVTGGCRCRGGGEVQQVHRSGGCFQRNAAVSTSWGTGTGTRGAGQARCDPCAAASCAARSSIPMLLDVVVLAIFYFTFFGVGEGRANPPPAFLALSLMPLHACIPPFLLH